MNEVKVDFSKKCGKMKPMHAVNNGPVHKFTLDQRISNLQWFIDAGIPYARTHDAAFYSTYGGEHTVDVHAIFPDFDKDANDPESYDFACTDEYLRVMDAAGVKPFYRLGSKIEHGVKKYGTVPPKDFYKWSVICEHIIRHYTEGWADGFNYDIEYWEIWNEPDCQNANGTNPCWQGTEEQFIDMFCIALKHLKKCFPHLKIGGPAFTHVNERYAKLLFDEIKKRGLTLDFFSWHLYAYDAAWVAHEAYHARRFLDENGFKDTESILNEWNYVRGWTNDDWIYTLKREKDIKGAAFIASAICDCQYAPLDMLMYYDARPCGMNGLFAQDIPSERLKGYYSLKMFNELYKLGESAKIDIDGKDIYGCAAGNSEKCAVMISYFNDDDNLGSTAASVDLSGIADGAKKCAKVYLLDREHDMELVREESIDGSTTQLTLDMPLFSAYLIVIE